MVQKELIDLEIRQLRYFLAVAENEHFGRASKRLNIVQPALSRQIAALEAELGIQLFERLPRGVRLTAAGAVFTREAQATIDRLELGVRNARAVAEGERGSLSVGIIDSAAWQGTVPDTLSWLRANYPEISLTVSLDASIALRSAVEAEILDIAFVYDNAPVAAGLVRRTVGRHGLALAVPKHHHLAGRSSVPASVMAEEDVIFFRRPSSPALHDRLLQALASLGVNPRLGLEGTSITEVLALVSAGLGVAAVNSEVRWRKPANVVLLPFDDLDLPLVLEAVYHEENRNPALGTFLGHLLRDDRLAGHGAA